MQHDDTIPQQEETFDLAHFDEPPASVAFGDEDSPIVELSIYDGLKTKLGNRIEINAEQDLQ